jgi:O-antigen/teichoic acid export membrane protein
VREKTATLWGAANATVREWRHVLDGRLALQGAASLADQVLISVAHLVTGLVLARHVAASDYGAYVLAFSILLFFTGLQTALITTPMTILATALEGEALRVHVSTMAVAQVILGVLCAGVCAGLAVAAAVAAPDSLLAPALLGLSVALPFAQCQELCRRVLFLRLQPGRVLANDLVDSGLRIALVLALLLLDRGDTHALVRLTPQNIFFATALASLVATLFGVWQCRELIGRHVLTTMGGVLRQSWSLARWGLGSQIGNVLMLQANRFVAAAFAGTAGVALLEAPRLLVAPLQAIATGAGNLTFPKAARSRAEGGTAGMLRFLRPVAVVWAATFFAYAAVLAAAPSFWLRLAYSGRYDDSAGILLLWCATLAVMGLRVLPGTALKVMRRLDLTMVAHLAAGGSVVVMSLAMCYVLGPAGAALAKLVGELMLVGVMALFLTRELRRGAPAPADGRETLDPEPAEVEP